MRAAVALACTLALSTPPHLIPIAHFASRVTTLVPGSRFALRLADGSTPQRSIVAAGEGTIANGTFALSDDASPGPVTIAALGSSGLATRTFRVVAAPSTPVLAVASYDDGVVFHDPVTFRALGTLATAGPPGDVAAIGNRLLTVDTDGTTATNVTLSPWSVATISNVPLGDEIAVDARSGAFFVTERQFDGKGGLARIDGARVTSVATGLTAEGIAVDARRGRVYVADANDDMVSVIEMNGMRVIERIAGLARAFSLALSPDGTRLYVVSNQGMSTPFAAPGKVTEIDVAGTPRTLARSPNLAFPLGVALDPATREVFVTDEGADVVYVLDARTLQPRHAPLQTCSTPWKPHFEASDDRLFVPCARSDEVDVFNARTLGRVAGAPFATGGYPLAVTIVRG